LTDRLAILSGVDTSAEPRWLSTAELHTWRSLMVLLARLPAALDVELQRDAELSFLEYYVLAELSEAPGQRVRLSELAELTNAELSRMSHLLSRLEKRGLAHREPDPTNRRYTRAVLTEAGMAHLARAAPNHVAGVRRLLFDALDADDLRQLDDVLDRVIARIGQPD